MNFGGTLRLNKFSCFVLLFVLFLIVYWRSGASSFPTEANDIVNLKSLLKAAIHAAERGGQKVIDGKNKALNIQSKGKTLEGAQNLVTDADYASHCAMYFSLKKTFPKISVVSEEHANNDPSCEDQEMLDVDTVPVGHRAITVLNDEIVSADSVTVWIDPLDATQEYTEELYQYITTMVCVAINGQPVIGVIHYPFPPRTYWGWNTKRVSTNIPDVPHFKEHKNAPRVVVSRSHPGKVEGIAKKAFGDTSVVTPAAGAGYKVMAVVNGTYDLYLHATNIKKWDICAGDAIIKAVNGEMTTAKGQRITYLPNEDVVVRDGLVVTRYDHEYYLDKLKGLL